MRKVEDNNKITHNMEKRRLMHNNIPPPPPYMNRVGGFLLQRQDMVIAYAHAHKTAIRWKRNAYGWTVLVTFDPVLHCAPPYPTYRYYVFLWNIYMYTYLLYCATQWSSRYTTRHFTLWFSVFSINEPFLRFHVFSSPRERGAFIRIKINNTVLLPWCEHEWCWCITQNLLLPFVE